MISEIDCCCGGGGVWEMGKERIFDNGILVIYTGIFFSLEILCHFLFPRMCIVEMK